MIGPRCRPVGYEGAAMQNDRRNLSDGSIQAHGITIREMRALREHNLYAYMPVLRVLLDIGPYVDRPSDELPEFTERLTSWLPGLTQHECSLGRPGGFVERLRRGTYLPHICEHVCLELQGLMGFNVTFGRARHAVSRRSTRSSCPTRKSSRRRRRSRRRCG